MDIDIPKKNRFLTYYNKFYVFQMLREGNYKAQLVLEFTETKITQPLTMAHIQGILALWLIGTSLASCQFLYERCQHKS